MERQTSGLLLLLLWFRSERSINDATPRTRNTCINGAVCGLWCVELSGQGAGGRLLWRDHAACGSVGCDHGARPPVSCLLCRFWPLKAVLKAASSTTRARHKCETRGRPQGRSSIAVAGGRRLAAIRGAMRFGRLGDGRAMQTRNVGPPWLAVKDPWQRPCLRRQLSCCCVMADGPPPH